MKICIITDIDCSAQCATLQKAFNRFTPHEARYIVCQSTYLNYDEDLNLTRTPQEKIIRVLDESDFYLFVRAPISFPFYDLAGKLHRRNHLVWLLGSEARLNFPFYLYNWLKRDTMYVTSMDYSYSSLVGFSAQHIPISIMLDEVPARQKLDDRIRVVHTPTNREIKGTDAFLRAMEEMKKKYPEIETVLIEGKPWKESLQLKSTCDICYDQCALQAYGMGAAESMAMGQPVLGRTSSWVKSFFDEDIPIIDCTPETLQSWIEKLVGDEDLRRVAGAQGRRFVERHHDARKNIGRWEHLTEFVRGR